MTRQHAWRERHVPQRTSILGPPVASPAAAAPATTASAKETSLPSAFSARTRAFSAKRTGGLRPLLSGRSSSKRTLCEWRRCKMRIRQRPPEEACRAAALHAAIYLTCRWARPAPPCRRRRRCPRRGRAAAAGPATCRAPRPPRPKRPPAAPRPSPPRRRPRPPAPRLPSRERARRSAARRRGNGGNASASATTHNLK